MRSSALSLCIFLLQNLSHFNLLNRAAFSALKKDWLGCTLYTVCAEPLYGRFNRGTGGSEEEDDMIRWKENKGC